MLTYTSQHGEDRRLEQHFGPSHVGFFVEVGALDGIELSNTFHFESALGWHGILIEANPEAARLCRENRPNSSVAEVAVVDPASAGGRVSFQVVDGFDALSSIGFKWWARRTLANAAETEGICVRKISVPTATLDDVLDKLNCPPDFEFMTIDIEGFELRALRGLSLGNTWRPRVLLIENGSGLIDPRLTIRLFRSGYGYLRSISVNDWYEPCGRAPRLMGVIRSELHGLKMFLKLQLLSLRGRSPGLQYLDQFIRSRHGTRGASGPNDAPRDPNDQ